MSEADRYERVVELFERCLAMAPEDRAAELARTCGDDEAMRREVEGMLAFDPTESATLDTPVRHMLESAMARAQADGAAMDEAPREIGRYRVIREIGRGGMGVVYEAEQDEPKRRVALKALPVLGAARLGQRLRQEAHVLGQLNHPGIARVYDAGAARVRGQTMPYIAMELVEGGALDAYATDRSLTVDQRLKLVARVADAVQAAHTRGIIHRDLKPGNILVAPEQRGVGQPKVLDFGVARLTNADLLVTSVKTETSQLIGTVHYMSPEQLGGDSRRVDARSDVYALGVIAYELLAGRRPFKLDGASLVEAVSRLQNARPEPLRAVDPTLSGDIDLIVATAMERDPARRYQTAAELAAEIRRCQRNEPILARPPSTAYQFRKFAQRNKAIVGAAAVAVLALVVGLGVSIAALGSATAARDQARDSLGRAVEAEALATSRADEAEAINEFLQDLLAEADPWRTGGDVTVRSAIAGSERLVAERFADRPAVEMGLRQSIGEAYMGLGLFDEAIVQFERVIELGLREGGEADERVLAARFALGRTCQRTGQIERGLEVVERIRRSDAFEHAGVDRRITLLILEGALTGNTGDFGQALRLGRLAREEAERELAPDDDVTLSSLNGVGWAALHAGESDEAAEAFRRLLEAHTAKEGPSHIKSIVARNGLAQAEFGAGRLEEAGELYRQNIAYGDAEFSEGHPELFVTLSGLSNVLVELRAFDEGITLAERALAMCEEARGPDHPHTMIVRNNHAELLSKLRRHDESLEIHLENLGRRRGTLGEDHPDVAQSLASIGTTYLRMRRSEDGERYLRDAIERYEKLYGRDSSEVVNNTMNLSQALRFQGKLDDAIKMMARVVESEKRTLPENHRYTALDSEKLAGMLYDAGRFAEATERWDEAIAMWVANHGEDDLTTIQWRTRAARSEFFAGNAERGYGELDAIQTMLTRDGAEHRPESIADVHLVRAQLLIEQGDLERASEQLRIAEPLLAQVEIDDDKRAWIDSLAKSIGDGRRGS